MVPRPSIRRVEINPDFGKNLPSGILRCRVGRTNWAISRTETNLLVVDSSNQRHLGKMFENAKAGSLFLTDSYCFFRYREFQLMLDMFLIDKVVNDAELNGGAFALNLVSGFGKETEDMGYSVYTNADFYVIGEEERYVGEDRHTKSIRFCFENPKWILVEIRNKKGTYRTLYTWGEKPQIMLKELSKNGIGEARIIG